MRARYLTQAEIDKLAQFMPSEAWLPLRVAFATGLRVGDVVRLRGWQVRQNGVVFCAEKTGKWGFAPCSASLARTLRKGIAARDYVFPSKTKRKRGHITRQAVWSRVKRACTLAGIDSAGISPHSFRKSFAVELLRKSDLRTVQEALQHSSAYVTEQYAFSDWSTGENAFLSVRRCDIPMIIGQILPYIDRAVDKAVQNLYNCGGASTKGV